MPKAAGADCEHCPLLSRPMVRSHVNGGGCVAIVGEAPGVQEVLKGLPFVGQSGRLLHKVLDIAGLESKVALITNTCLCRPPHNDEPLDAAIRCCAPRLQAELDAANPEVVLLLGNSALQMLHLGKKITMARGQRIAYNGHTYVPTFHPAAVLRRPSMFADFAADIASCLHPRTPLLEVVSAVVQPDELEFVCERLLTKPLLACDIETSGYNSDKDRVLCISFAYRDDRALVIPQEMVNSVPVKKLLQEHPGLLFHNGKFDALFLWAATGIRPRIAHDSMLAHYTTDERKGTHGLKELMASLFGAPDWEAAVHATLKKKSDSYENVPRDILYEYAGIDAAFTVHLYNYLRPQIDEDPPLRKLYDRLLWYANNLLEIEHNGMLIDLKALGALDVEFAAIEKKLAAEMQPFATGIGLSSGGFNPRSPLQLGIVLFDRLKFAPVHGRSTNAEVLEVLQKKYGAHPFVRALAEYRHVSKLRSTYVANIRELTNTDGYIHGSFQIHGTETGRFSMSRPNLLNLPRTSKSDHAAKIKKLFVAPEGWAVVSADYKQAEMRVMAWLANEPYLVEQFKAHNDLHTEAAKRLFKTETPTKEQRMVAKMFNFGLIYGRTAYSVSTQLGIPLRAADKMLTDFFGLMPNVRAWIDRTRLKAKLSGYLETPMGRRRRFGLITPETWKDVANEASNFPPSSISSDVTAESMIEILNDPRLPHDKVRTLMMVHDSIVLYVRKDFLDQATAVIRDDMCNVVPKRLLGDSVPFDIDVDSGPSWGDV
jgi:DNA polymerase I